MGMKPGYKQTEIGIIPEAWALSALGDLVDASRGIRYGIVQPGTYDRNGRYMVRGQDYSKGWVDPTEFFRVSARVEEPFANARIKPGDVLVTIVGASTGRIAIVPEWLDGANLTQTTARVSINNTTANSAYCGFILSSWYGIKQVQNYIKGGAQPGLNCGDLENFIIPLPPTKAEQMAIAEALSDADALIESLEQLIAKKCHLKQGTMQELLTGKKRLPGFEVKPGYKQTEIGVIPEDWDLFKLAQICGFITKGATPTTYGFSWEQSGILFLRSECVSEKGLDLSQSMFISSEAHTTLRRSAVADGDILITITGNVGRVILLNGVGEANLNQHIARVRVTAEHAHVGYVFHILSQPITRARFLSITTGQAYPQISLRQVREAKIPLPPIKAEQEAIAETLTNMDTEIAALKAKLTKMRHIKQGMMQELLTGRIRLI